MNNYAMSVLRMSLAHLKRKNGEHDVVVCVIDECVRFVFPCCVFTVGRTGRHSGSCVERVSKPVVILLCSVELETLL